jgi:hypothetical protein
MMTVAPNKKAKKSRRPRASTGSTHHGMRYADAKLFSSAKLVKKAKDFPYMMPIAKHLQGIGNQPY